MVPSEPAPAESVEQLTEELARAKAERDAALQALGRLELKGLRHHAHRGLVGFLVVVFALLLPITFTVTWTHYTVLNTNGWVRTVTPLSSNPAVASAVATTVTDQVFTALNAQQQISGVLPPRASFLAGPITSGVKGYLQGQVARIIKSSQFKAIWVAANRFAHTELIRVLEGRSRAVATTNGQVVLNLVPLLDQALVSVRPFVSGVVGRPVTLPSISQAEVPAEACRRIGAAINRTLPDNCAQIPLFPANKLTLAQRLVRVFNGVMVLLLVLTPVVAALALVVSKRRRRTLLQLAVGGFLGLVVFRRIVSWMEGTLVVTTNVGTREARQAILDRVLHVYFDVSVWLLVALGAVVVVAAVTGPYAWARPVRREAVRFARSGGAVVMATASRARSEATLTWMRSHVDLLRIGGVVVAVILLLALPVSWVGVIVIAALLGLYELWLQRFRPRPTTGSDASP